jgi:hypothetical protein
MLFLPPFVKGQNKLSPNLHKNSGGRWEVPSTLTLLVENPSEFKTTYEAQIKKLIQNGSLDVITVEFVNIDIIDKLLKDDNIQFIDLVRTPKEEALLDEPNFHYNRIRKWQHENGNIETVTPAISIKEQRFKTEDIDIRNKFFSMNTEGETFSDHATSMATIIAGRGNSSIDSKGILPEAKLSSSDYNNLLPDDDRLLTANEVYTQNHSYGVGIENYYGIEAMKYDQSTYESETIVHVFSVGNAGNQVADHGQYEGLAYANLTGTFKQAKNIITVASVDTSLTISALASRGPAYDGRLKPELSAYGGRGTSDAAAIVSGIVAAIQSQFFEKHNQQPTSSLLKSILIASADDIGNIGPDFATGYGSVNAKKAAQVQERQWHEEVTLQSNSTSNLSIILPEDVHEIRVAICWTDPAASIDATSALVNDIDGVLSLGATSFKPWVLNPAPNIAALSASATKSEDHLNNVELITVESPTAGIYNLEIKSPIMNEDQVVSVAWYYSLKNHFDWDYPIETDQIIAGSLQKLYWETTYEDVTGKLELKLGEGAWQLIDGTVELTKIKEIKIPEETSRAQLRMSIADSIYLSGEFFIGNYPDINVTHNCDSTFGLGWEMVPEAVSYNIYEMGKNSMERIGTTTNNYFPISKSSEVFYSVAANYDSDIAFRSNALNYQFQGALCYINFFSAQRVQDAVQLSLDLSTENEVSSIEIFKSYDNIKGEKAFDITPSGFASYLVSDSSINSGLVQYVAVLSFANGKKIFSDTISLLVDNPGKVILYPNPSTQGYIYILSSGTGQRLQILDSRGKLVLEKDLEFREEEIILKDFRQGIYYYRLMDDNKKVDEGKFIKY